MKQQLGHYDIVAELGRGGMGVVYKGYEASLNRYVAIKVLADSLAHDASVKERFLREARSMAALNDPHIIQIFFIGEDEFEPGQTRTYFVMEFVDGESLGSILKREGLLRPEQAARVIYQTALGLSTAHDRGVIHRDIKPGNMMITSRGNVKIADFGIALSSQDFSKKLTSTGEFVGTPGYLSPEVCLGKPVDQRSDIFSLGIVLFEMLAGRMPFTDESPLGLMLEVVKAEIPDVCTLNSEVDPELARILSRMIAKDPVERYQSCQELIADLSRHPLLAAAATLQLPTQLSPAAATVIGMKTPISGQVALPVTTPTPLPRSTPMPPTAVTPARAQAAVAPAVIPAAPNYAGAAAAKKKSSVAVPLTIAAALVLGVAGGAWAFRDRIPFLQQWLPATTQLAAVTPTTATPPVAPPPPAMSTTASATPPPATVATTEAAGTAPASGTTASSAATAAPATGDASASAGSASSAASQNASVADLLGNPPPPPPAPGSAAQSAGPAARASQVDALRDLPAAQAAATAVGPAPQVARIVPPPPIAPPHIPTVAVISGGDTRVAEPAARVIEQALARRGYHVVGSEMLPLAESFLGERRNNVPGLLGALARAGRADAVVIVHAHATGATNLQYYGQSDTATTAQLNINVYAVQSQRKLHGGWSENVMYTGLSAKQQGEEAVEEIAPELERLLEEYRPGRNRG